MTVSEWSWISKDRTRFYAVEWRPPHPKAAILVVHGMGEHSRRYDALAEEFCTSGLALLSFDQRGHGRTAGKRGHIPSMDRAMDDIEHFLAELKSRFIGLPCFLFGQSMGGMEVLNFTLTRHPEIDGVISTSPALAPGVPIPPLKLFFANLLYSLLPDFTLPNGLDLNNLSHDPNVIAAYQQDPLVTTLVSARLGLDVINTGRWVEEHGEDFTIPLLLMQGTADHLTSPAATRRFAARVPREFISYHEWDGLYHELYNEPEHGKVISEMIGWVQSQL
jgi:alpha-beta hydrolase superfamily lysophospholipase